MRSIAISDFPVKILTSSLDSAIPISRKTAIIWLPDDVFRCFLLYKSKMYHIFISSPNDLEHVSHTNTNTNTTVISIAPPTV